MVYLGADHAGFGLKEKVKKFLEVTGIPFEDLGALKFDPEDDYPKYAEKIARKVAAEPESRGVLVCGSGTGMVIAANKVPGVRAAFGFSDYAAKMARHDNNANVITFSGRKQSPEDVIKMVKIFLETEFSGEPRHRRRLEEVARIGNANK